MTIEQEFFEAFGVKPDSQTVLVKLCPHVSPFDGVFGHAVADSTPTYPPITPGIVLGLEEIVNNLNINKGFIIGFICHFNKDEGCYAKEKGDCYIRAYGKNRIEALLKLCIKLKDEIQDQVKALFRC